jgi:hypothetical protein
MGRARSIHEEHGNAYKILVEEPQDKTRQLGIDGRISNSTEQSTS